jgi:hypothetical protein
MGGLRSPLFLSHLNTGLPAVNGPPRRFRRWTSPLIFLPPELKPLTHTEERNPNTRRTSHIEFSCKWAQALMTQIRNSDLVGVRRKA